MGSSCWSVGRLRYRCRNGVNDLIQNHVGRLTVGMSIEIQNDAMAQDRRRQFTHVVDTQVVAAAQESQRAPAFHQGLRTARRTAVPDVLFSEVVGIGATGLSRHHQIDRVILHVRGDKDVAADVRNSRIASRPIVASRRVSFL